VQLVAQQVGKVFHVLQSPRATNFHFAVSGSDVYFMQHENLLRKEVVIRVTDKTTAEKKKGKQMLPQANCCTEKNRGFSDVNYSQSLNILAGKLVPQRRVPKQVFL